MKLLMHLPIILFLSYYDISAIEENSNRKAFLPLKKEICISPVADFEERNHDIVNPSTIEIKKFSTNDILGNDPFAPPEENIYELIPGAIYQLPKEEFNERF